MTFITIDLVIILGISALLALGAIMSRWGIFPVALLLSLSSSVLAELSIAFRFAILPLAALAIFAGIFEKVASRYEVIEELGKGGTLLTHKPLFP